MKEEDIEANNDNDEADPFAFNFLHEVSPLFNEDSFKVLLLLGLSTYPTIDQLKTNSLSFPFAFSSFNNTNKLDVAHFLYTYPFTFSAQQNLFSFCKPEYSHLRFVQPNIHVGGI